MPKGKARAGDKTEESDKPHQGDLLIGSMITPLTDSLSAIGLDDFHQKRSYQRTRKTDNVVIGVIDSGIVTKSRSFGAQNMKPPPPYWKGSDAFKVNNKIVCARTFDKESVEDATGHGTSCAAIACGNMIPVRYGSFKSRYIRGCVPNAHVAMYRVSSEIGQYIVLNTIVKRAVSDGVKVLSISGAIIGTNEQGEDAQFDLLNDELCEGTYYAVKNGVLSCLAAGNYYGEGKVLNNYPWALCVGSSYNNVTYITKVLVEGFVLEGHSINPRSTKRCELIHFSSARVQKHLRELNPSKVYGKIVVYPPEDVKSCRGGYFAKIANAAGMLVIDQSDGNEVKEPARTYALPAARLTYSDGIRLLQLMKKGMHYGEIKVSKEVKEEKFPAPVPMSARGPNKTARDIQKPDVLAIGTNILTATLNEEGENGYAFESGTSVANPMVAGAAAHVIRHLMSNNEEWSPAEIKSALMTTATPIPIENMNSARDILAIGSGLINAKKAERPGFVFDVAPIDYLRFFRHQGYSASDLRYTFKTDLSGSDPLRASELNFPSFKSKCLAGSTIYFKRRVKYTEKDPRSFQADFSPSCEALDIDVEPRILTFTSQHENKDFALRITVNSWEDCEDDLYFTNLVWESRDISVRCPIIITRPNTDEKHMKVESGLKIRRKSTEEKNPSPSELVTVKKSRTSQDASIKTKVNRYSGGQSSKWKAKAMRD